MFKTKRKKSIIKTVVIDSCQDMNLLKYIEIIRNKDLSVLHVSGPKPSHDVLVDAMTKINEELIELRGDNQQKLRFDKITYMEQIKLKIFFCHSIVERLQQRVDLQVLNKELFEKYIEQLKVFGFRLNKDKPLYEELMNVIQELKGYQSTVDALHAEIYPEGEENELDGTKLVAQFYAMLLSYQRILNIDKINVKDTNLIEFVAIENAVKEIIASKPQTK